MPKNRIKFLTEELIKHNELYYNQDNPSISDKEYDMLYKELVQLEEQYPQYILPYSPTKKVGATVAGGAVTHAVPMLSLENSYNREDVAKFLTKVKESGFDAAITVEPKMDGAAVSVTYNNGVFVAAATRGDGVVGEDITENVRTIKSLPTKIDFKGLLIVRGEVFMPKEQFDRLNSERSLSGQNLFANPRNAASGSLKLLDSSEAAKRGLDIYIYNVDVNTGNKSHSEDLAYIKTLGFPVNDLNAVCKTENDVFERLDAIESVRFTLPYDIDGAVIKVNEYAVREEMGSTGKFPKWAVAYKYEALQATTLLKDVTFQVGRTGAVTPVAELEPVFLSGSTISRASLHNEDEINRIEVMIGDTVFIEKGGEIIPKVVKVVMDKRPADAKKIIFPEDCPICGSKLSKPEGEVRWRCFNLSCAARIKGVLIHFASRDAMFIDGLGETLINALVDEGRLKTIPDIFTLTKEELAIRERMGERSATKIIEAVEKSKEQPFAKVLFAMGLPQVGVSTARSLARHFGSMDKLMNATLEDLTSINDIGGKTAEGLVNTFADKAFKELVDSLKSAGLRFEADAESLTIAADSKIAGKSFLITGTLSVPRKTMEDKIMAAGGVIAGSVNKNLDYLIVGEKAGSKLDKAKKAGVKVLTEDEAENLIK